MNELIKYNNCDFTKNQLVFSETITKEEWEEIGYGLSKINKSVGIWMGDWIRFGDTKGYVNSKVYDEIVRLTGMNRKTLQNYKNVAEKTSELRKSSRRREDIDFSYYAEVAPLSTEKQTELLDKAEEKNWSSKQLREEIRKEKKLFEVKELPTGVFNVVYCDPPWQYTPAEETRQVENHYPTMPDEEIYNLKLPELADDCLLLIWATSGKLPTALKTIEAWGFTYKSSLVWDKEIIGMGYWFRGQHEFLIVATRGKFSPPEIENRISSVYREKRTEHSKKPNFFYDWIELAFPNTKKIELFARQKYNDNWEVWGNE